MIAIGSDHGGYKLKEEITKLHMAVFEKFNYEMKYQRRNKKIFRRKRNRI